MLSRPRLRTAGPLAAAAATRVAAPLALLALAWACRGPERVPPATPPPAAAELPEGHGRRPGESLEAYYLRNVEEREEELRRSYRRGEAPEPGVAAEVGMFLLLLGDAEGAEDYFYMELANYPQSAELVELLRAVPRRAGE